MFVRPPPVPWDVQVDSDDRPKFAVVESHVGSLVVRGQNMASVATAGSRPARASPSPMSTGTSTPTFGSLIAPGELTSVSIQVISGSEERVKPSAFPSRRTRIFTENVLEKTVRVSTLIPGEGATCVRPSSDRP